MLTFRPDAGERRRTRYADSSRGCRLQLAGWARIDWLLVSWLLVSWRLVHRCLIRRCLKVSWRLVRRCLIRRCLIPRWLGGRLLHTADSQWLAALRIPCSCMTMQLRLPSPPAQNPESLHNTAHHHPPRRATGAARPGARWARWYATRQKRARTPECCQGGELPAAVLFRGWA